MCLMMQNTNNEGLEEIAAAVAVDIRCFPDSSRL